MLDWRKILDQMLWHNYQLVIGMKLVNRIRNDFPETIKESLRDQESWKGNMMSLFDNGHLYDEEGTKGNKWINSSIEFPEHFPKEDFGYDSSEAYKGWNWKGKIE